MKCEIPIPSLILALYILVMCFAAIILILDIGSELKPETQNEKSCCTHVQFGMNTKFYQQRATKGQVD